MDFGYLTPLIDKVMDDPLLYLGYAVLVYSALYYTRDYVVPLVQFVVEVAIYLGCMHMLVHYLTRLAAWFSVNTSMAMTRPEGVGPERVYWTTPLMRFWERDVYDPAWLLHLEAVAAVLIMVFTLRFRSLDVGGRPPVRFDAEGNRIKLRMPGPGFLSRIKKRVSRKFGVRDTAPHAARLRRK